MLYVRHRCLTRITYPFGYPLREAGLTCRGHEHFSSELSTGMLVLHLAKECCPHAVLGEVGLSTNFYPCIVVDHGTGTRFPLALGTLKIVVQLWGTSNSLPRGLNSDLYAGDDQRRRYGR